MSNSARATGRLPELMQGIAFATVAIGCWSLLALLSMHPGPTYRAWQVTPTLVTFLILGGAARLLSLRPFANVRIALDSPFYVAATFIVGTVPAALLIVTILSVDGLSRHGVRAIREATVAELSVVGLIQVLYHGALPAAVLLATGTLFGVDGLGVVEDTTLAWEIPAFALAFIVPHYALAGGSHYVHGASPSELLRGRFVQVIGAEIALVPLAMAMVLGYVHQGLGLFVLLGGTGLLFNAIFRRALVTGEHLRSRVEELSTLNRIGRLLSGSLDRQTLLRNIATETHHLVGGASEFSIALLDEKGRELLHESFAPDGEPRSRWRTGRGEGLVGWVLEHGEPLLLGDMRRRDRSALAQTQEQPSSMQSWLGVPLRTHGSVMGALVVRSERRRALTEEHVRVLGTMADQAAVALENARLYELATEDGLTGLFVRRYFEHRLREEWRRVERYGGQFVVGMMDLDDFKRLNDTLGHPAGDKMLQQVARVLRDNMRGPDLAARFGGEEFAFLLPRTSLHEARSVAERIRAGVEAIHAMRDPQAPQVTASIGLAALPARGVDSVEALIARSDQALYLAKRAGKNRVVVVSDDEDESDSPISTGGAGG